MLPAERHPGDQAPRGVAPVHSGVGELAGFQDSRDRGRTPAAEIRPVEVRLRTDPPRLFRPADRLDADPVSATAASLLRKSRYPAGPGRFHRSGVSGWRLVLRTMDR